ncbi:MAG: hydroxyisourate hydrolase [Opitutaceae bacterium]
MPGKLSTHVLDTYHGRPACGVGWELELKTESTGWVHLKSGVTNADGRTDGLLLENDELQTGTYRLTFDIAGYFRRQEVALPDAPFLGNVVLEVNLSFGESYHVPLLCSPWSYSTYRGS